MGTSAASDAVLTMWPPSPCARMRGRKVCKPLMTPPRLTARGEIPAGVGDALALEGTLDADSGVVHQHVHAAEDPLGLIGRSRHAGAIRDLEAHGMHLRGLPAALEETQRGAAMVLPQIRDDHLHAGIRKGAGDPQHHAAGTPGDKRHPALNILHDPRLPSGRPMNVSLNP
jgi:hypothetical protein